MLRIVLMKQEDLYHAVNEVKSVVKDTNEKVASIDKTLALNTQALEEHMKRTDILEQMIKPMYEERISAIAIKNYKEENKKDILYSLKLPVAIVAAVGAVGTIIAWLMDII